MAEMRSATPWIAILFSFCYSVEWKKKKIPADDDIYFSVVDFIFVTVKVNDIFISVEDIYFNILYVDTICVNMEKNLHFYVEDNMYCLHAIDNQAHNM